MAKYTVSVNVQVVLEVEADSYEQALDEACESWTQAAIEIDCEYHFNEAWDDAEVYNENGDLIDLDEEKI